MSKGAVYARSAVRDNKNINSQVKSSTEFGRKLGVDVAKIYIDSGKPGTTISRPSLTQLLADARARKFDTLISSDPTRLARNANVYKSINKELKSAGVKNIYVNQTDDANEFADSVSEAFADFDWQLRSSMVKRGIRAAKERKAKK